MNKTQKTFWVKLRTDIFIYDKILNNFYRYAITQKHSDKTAKIEKSINQLFESKFNLNCSKISENLLKTSRDFHHSNISENFLENIDKTYRKHSVQNIEINISLWTSRKVNIHRTFDMLHIQVHFEIKAINQIKVSIEKSMYLNRK